ncbi:SGNH hydrolase [Setomelanomma holmii]|uniref:SGNH hydrolase n=1 Tax=Setomelanomma holmii TaxID=210430 RepID=A0A9P4H7D9_9PLEO|nr:SGNH hydrolase [Setomelanomma holmii]
MHLTVQSAIVAALFLTAAVTAAPATLAERQSTVKIMALGDSITGSPGCWRAYLWQKLQAAGIKNTDFVGTLPAQGCGFTYDGENEGHGGYLATNIANQNLLPGWLSSTKPDIVMMHLGTNDVWNNLSPTTITTAFSTLVDQMRASKSTMKILVAQIIPMNPSNCAECGARVVALNQEIAKWAVTKNSSSSPITVVDVWTGFQTGSMTVDGVHPNDAGNKVLANSWYQAVANAIKG